MDSCDFDMTVSNRDGWIFGIKDGSLKNVFFKEVMTKLNLFIVIKKCEVSDITVARFQDMKTTFCGEL